MNELTEIGKKINKAIEAIKDVGLTQKEISIFEEFIAHQEAIQSLVNPTNFMRVSKMLDMVKKRLDLLKPIVNLGEEK